MIQAIVATNNKGYIGLDGGLPWKKCGADFAHFRKLTAGWHMVAGSKTYDALDGKIALGDRVLLRFSENPRYVTTVTTKNIWIWERLYPLMVIGGKQTYEALAPYITTWHVSLINDDTVGDTQFGIQEINHLCMQSGGRIVTYEF